MAVSTTEAIDFQVDRDDLRHSRLVVEADRAPLAEGQVRFAIDRFALTSNNVSYAVAGDLLGYWGFFPAPDRWGRVPAMGFGDVVESRHPEVAVGTRCFGFFPMASELVVDARPSGDRLVDAAPHRAQHAPVYRSYVPTGADPLHAPAREDEILLLRGLFLTSFLIDDFLAEVAFPAADLAIVTSASSKTSIALAHLLSRREGVRVVGLTSARNETFVRGLGCYDEVVGYDGIGSIEHPGRAVLVDMAGDADVVARVHERFGDRLLHSATVGATHWESKPRSGTLPGPAPEFFFAPARIVKRSADWGPGGVDSRLGLAWQDFLPFVDTWLRVERHVGPEALERLWLDALGGRLDPR